MNSQPLDHTPNAIGIFIAVKKKGSNIVLIEGDQEKETFEFVVQVVMPTEKFEKYTLNKDIFQLAMHQHAFDAYMFRTYGEKVKDLTKEDYEEEFKKFQDQYLVLLSSSPVVFDYLIEDRFDFNIQEEREGVKNER
jgi:hypothetical protein